MSDQPPQPPKKEMEITGKTIEFSHEPQTDAEGQAARIRYHSRAGVGAGQSNRGELGNLPAVVEYKTNVGDMANAAMTACRACKHWDQPAMQRFISRATGPASRVEDRQTVKGMLGRLMEAGLTAMNEDGTINEAETLMNLGICRPLSDIIEGMVGRDPMHWPAISWSTATCPSYVAAGPHRLEITTPAQPLGLFKPLDSDAVKIGNSRRDAILFDASGKGRR